MKFSITAIKRAFTLIELLVVIAIIAILAAMLLPSLARAKARGQAVLCMNNTKQLMVAWRMYPDDFADKVTPNFGVNETMATIAAGTFRNWVNNVMSWGPDIGNTNVAYVKNGVLSPYLSGNLGVYKCPADNYLSSVQTSRGWTGRARSMSMNAFFGPFNENLNDPNWPRGRNQFFASYRQWLKLGDVPRPSNYWVTIDEHPDSINDGYFLNDPSTVPGNWEDIPASYHNGACGISYADGHSVIHKWRSGASIIPVRYSYGPPAFDSLGRTDYQWLSQQTAVLY